MRCVLVMPESLRNRLAAHLFPGDGDEHGAVIAAGIVRTRNEIRLLTRELFIAKDGVDYVPGNRGYRMLRAEFITDKILYCQQEQLCYLAVHNHGGNNCVRFSDVDLASHERGYPALLDIMQGLPVGGLVFAENAIAGDIWLSRTNRLPIAEARILGSRIQCLYPAPPLLPLPSALTYDRQTRLFGDVGQHHLSVMKIGVIGAGGVGALVIEYLARLGVGHIVCIDPDRVDITNLPRIPGATGFDAMSWLTRSKWKWARKLGKRLATKKIKVAYRVAKRANRKIVFDGVFGDVTDAAVAHSLVDCDFLFLAADTMQARLVFNALVHQYFVPGVQVGSKVRHVEETGAIADVYSIVRPVSPDRGCLLCNELISPAGLQVEALSEPERREQRYVDDPEIVAPSVITLNAVGASHAVNEHFLFSVLGLTSAAGFQGYVKYCPLSRDVEFQKPRSDRSCPMCGDGSESIRGRGGARHLPVRNWT